MDEQRKIDKLYELLEEKERKKDTEAAVALRWAIYKSDVCLMTGSVLITVSLIMWETFGMMITPTVLTVAAAGCFVATVLCTAREEELRSRKRKRR